MNIISFALSTALATATTGTHCAGDSLPCTLDSIAAPFRVVDLAGHLDGGSVSGVIIDANGVEVPFWWDGAARNDDDPKAHAPRLVYVNCARKPIRLSGLPLALGGACEGRFITILRSFADSVMSPAEQDSLAGFIFDYSIPMPKRQPAIRALSEPMHNALEAHRLASILEEQRRR